MLTNLQKNDEIGIPFEAVPRIHMKHLNEELRSIMKLLGDTRRNERLACYRMVGYVMVRDGLNAEDVTTNMILTNELETVVKEWSSQTNCDIISYARCLCRLLGNHALFPFVKKTQHHHPLAQEWAETLPKSIMTSARSSVNYFLRWLANQRIYRCESYNAPVQLISRQILVRYRSALLRRVTRGHISPKTAQSHLQYVIRWLRWLHSRGKIVPLDLNKLCIKVRESTPRALPSHDDVGAFLSALISHQKWGPFVSYFLLMVCFGARPIELRLLTFSRVDFEHHRVFLQSKRGSGRWMTPPSEIWNCFAKYVSFTFGDRQCEGYVFAHRNGKPFSVSYVCNLFNKICSIAGIKIQGQMAFRHRFATDCLEAGIPLNTTRYMMDHSDASQLMRYQHFEFKFISKHVNDAFSVIPWAGDGFV